MNISTHQFELIGAGATFFMAGLIWFVQIVHYPLMARVGEEQSRPYAIEHQNRTTLVVAPAMLIEALAAALLVLRDPHLDAREIAASALLALAWISTFAVQVPLHAKLGRGFDAQVHRRLVLNNWVRTFAWSARAAILLLTLFAGEHVSTVP